MAQVFNWHLGRKMEYPYSENRPDRQFSAVFDVNKCIACQTCTYACKTTWTSGKGQEYMYWNNVETKPWGSFPMGWDVKALDLLGAQKWAANGVFDGKTIFEGALGTPHRALGYIPKDRDWAHPNRGEDETNGLIDPAKYYMMLPHAIWQFYLARVCNHCTYPACLAACPRKAIYKRKEDGIVLIDQQRCRGYRQCVRACPYKKAMYNHITRVSEKCIFCFPAVEKGEWPRCMRNCIGKIRMVGYLNQPDKANPENPMDFLVHTKKVAVPLFPQYGTEPNVLYIPPIHVPDEFNRQMFGPAALKATETYRNMRAGKEPELRGLLLLFVSTNKILSKFSVTADEAIGYDEKGADVVRVPLTEKPVKREFYDSTRNVYRHNMT